MPEIKIDDIRRQLADISIKSKIDAPEEKPGESFSNYLQDALGKVNEQQIVIITKYVKKVG